LGLRCILFGLRLKALLQVAGDGAVGDVFAV